MEKKVLIVNGSATAPSSKDVVSGAFKDILSGHGLHTKLVNVYELNLPLLIDEENEVVKYVRSLVEESEVVILVTPLYHGSFSGLLKLFLDQLSRDAFANKRVVLVSCTQRVRNSQIAAHELMSIVWTMKGAVHRLVGVCADDLYVDDSGSRKLAEGEISQRIHQIAEEISLGKSR
jgi:FMN reductase